MLSNKLISYQVYVKGGGELYALHQLVAKKCVSNERLYELSGSGFV